MIRRRSCITETFFDVLGLKSFNDKQRRKIFRSSVKFKRYHFKGTKFKRRQIRKLKHKSNWALQYNIISYWTSDLRVARQYARYQYHYRFFVNNSIITHRTTWSARRNRLFLTQGQWVSSSITRQLFLTAGGSNNEDVLKSQKHDYHALAFYPTDEMIGDMSTTPFLSVFDRQLFTTNVETELKNLDVFENDFILDALIFQQLTEIYKIMTLLWYKQLLIVNKNVYWL